MKGQDLLDAMARMDYKYLQEAEARAVSSSSAEENGMEWVTIPLERTSVMKRIRRGIGTAAAVALVVTVGGSVVFLSNHRSDGFISSGQMQFGTEATDRTPLEQLEQVESETESQAESQTDVSALWGADAQVTSGAAYIYRGEPVKISYEYSIEGEAQSFGLMVLCDGIAVPFATDQNEGASVLQIVPNQIGETVSVDLFVTPIGQEGDWVSVQIVDIIEPDFDIHTLNLDTEDAAPVVQALVYGRRYDVNSIAGLSITMEKDGISSETTISEAVEIEEIPQNVIEANKEIKEDGTVTNQLSFFKATTETFSLLYQLEKGEILPLDFTLSGTEGQDVFVSFYLNNEIYSVFDGCEYVRCHVDQTHYTKVHGELDTSELEVGRYICYTVCGNVEYNMHTDPISAFILEVT
ncbi:MAG: hypothetical protein IJY85_02470 [Ruminococcus sp.]|nr:hypothetical protein [Ruminococcus sp.]